MPNIQLLGPQAGYPSFRAVDDRVRGGSSTSHFVVTPAHTSAVFSGHLDIETLGGAGFASQSTSFSIPPNLPTNCSTLLLRIRLPLSAQLHNTSTPTKFNLNLKNEHPEDRGDGWRKSGLSYEFGFDLQDLLNNIGEKGVVEVVMRREDFKATYRGRKVEGAKKLDLANILELSFMCRSMFGEQKGDFELEIISLEALHSGTSWFSKLVQCLRAWWVTFVTYSKGTDRGLRLP